MVSVNDKKIALGMLQMILSKHDLLAVRRRTAFERKVSAELLFGNYDGAMRAIYTLSKNVKENRIGSESLVGNKDECLSELSDLLVYMGELSASGFYIEQSPNSDCAKITGERFTAVLKGLSRISHCSPNISISYNGSGALDLAGELNKVLTEDLGIAPNTVFDISQMYYSEEPVFSKAALGKLGNTIDFKLGQRK